MKAMKRKGWMAGLLMTATLFAATGCQTIKEAGVNVETAQAEAAMLSQRAQEPMPSRKADPIQASDGIWLGNQSFRSAHGDVLPSALNNVTLITTEPMTLRDLAREITNLTGITVTIEAEVTQAAPAAAPAAEAADATAAAGGSPMAGQISPLDVASASMQGQSVPQMIGVGGAPAATSDTSAAPAGLLTDTMSFHHVGSLSSLMDKVSTGFGTNWAYSSGDSEIRIFTAETRIFSILAMPGTSRFSGSFESEASQDSGGGGEGSVTASTLTANQQTETEAEFDFWTEINDTIGNLLPAAYQDLVIVSPGSGTVTVTAPPYAMRRVETYINEQNERLARQITVQVTILTIDVSDVDVYEHQLTGTLRSVLDHAPTEADNPFNSGFAFTNEGSVLGTDDSPFGLLMQGIAEDTLGLQMMINALSQAGRVSERSNTAVTTMNGRPAPIQVVEQTGYVRERAITTDENGNVQTSVTPGQVTTGLTVNLLPRILNDGQVMMNYNLAISRLTSLETFGDADSQIQLPTTETRALMQQVMMRSGSTLVMAGFERKRANTQQRGLGTPSNWLLGGGKRGEVGNTALIIMLTPRVLRPLTDSFAPDAS
jgi:type IVB pilus formation R64 PilN family outer membrane protein